MALVAHGLRGAGAGVMALNMDRVGGGCDGDDFARARAEQASAAEERGEDGEKKLNGTLDPEVHSRVIANPVEDYLVLDLDSVLKKKFDIV